MYIRDKKRGRENFSPLKYKTNIPLQDTRNISHLPCVDGSPHISKPPIPPLSTRNIYISKFFLLVSKLGYRYNRHTSINYSDRYAR